MCKSTGSGDEWSRVNYGCFDVCSFHPWWEVVDVCDRAAAGHWMPVVVCACFVVPEEEVGQFHYSAMEVIVYIKKTKS